MELTVKKKMGSGIARAIRNKWPVVNDKYVSSPRGKEMLGTVSIVCVCNEETDPLYVANCYTQLYYGRDGKRYASPSAIYTSLDETFRVASAFKLPVYMPKIGCGLGGLNWFLDVEPSISTLAKKHNVEVFVCEL